MRFELRPSGITFYNGVTKKKYTINWNSNENWEPNNII